ncbi:MAG: hypothetical protein RLZZ165_501 [Bacteroidota bacterium]|jgi:hypothetical protein
MKVAALVGRHFHFLAVGLGQLPASNARDPLARVLQAELG